LAIALTAAEHRDLIPARERAVRGILLVRAPQTTGVWLREAAAVLDTAATTAYVRRFDGLLSSPEPLPSIDPTDRLMHGLLACPVAMRDAATSRRDSLAPPCSFR
jgi:hypothetical protein